MNFRPEETPLAIRALSAAMILLAVAFFVRQEIGLWTLDADGLSVITRTTPYWDFSNLWAGGHLAGSGEVAALFDAALYRQKLSAFFAAPIVIGEWSYPPTMLMIGAPLALMPAGTAYLIWTIGGIALFAAALTTVPMARTARYLAVLSPAVAINALFGQNGALTGALLMAGLGLAERRPAVSGLLIGCLCIKPHLAILVPVAFAASGNWRAFGAAAASSLTLSALSAAFFGLSAWTGFLEVTRPMMTAILEADFGQGYQANVVTVFMLVRALGGSLGTAYGIQTLIALLAAAATWLLWRNRQADRPMRLAATIGLTFLAIPYGYSYDMAPTAAAAAMLMTARLAATSTLTAFACWICPLLVNAVNQHYGLPLAPLLIAPMTVRCMVLATRRPVASKAEMAAGDNRFART